MQISKQKTYILLSILFLFSIFQITSCNQIQSTSLLTLDSNYSYTLLNDNIEITGFLNTTGLKFKTFDNSLEISHLESLLPNNKGYILLQTHFTIPQNLINKDIALLASKLQTAGRYYVNNVFIGQTGQFPPNEFGSGTEVLFFNIPSTAITYTNENKLQILLYINGKGSIQTFPIIGEYTKIHKTAIKETFLMSEVNILAATFMLLIAILYLLVFFRFTSMKEYLYYALTNICTALYLFPLYFNELSWNQNIFPYLTFNKLFSGYIAIFTSWIAVSFIRAFLKITVNKKVNLIRIGLLLTSFIFIFFIPNIQYYNKIQHVIYLFVFIQVFFAITALIKTFRVNKKDATQLLIGFSPVLIAVLIDFISKIILKANTMPIVTVFGWQAVIIIFLFILTNRFNSYRIRAEYLNKKLEQEVSERTKELLETNKKLKFEQYKTQRDTDLAVHVQQGFYPNASPSSPIWDTAFYFKPVSGVSGDLYDFYVTNNNFDGLSLFDVSGHGTAAGLVAMLVKNIITRIFNASHEQSLSSVFYDINNAIIKSKGDIENYLTGILLRFNKDDNRILEIVNAGNPPPIYNRKNAETSIELIYPDTSKQYGMIGINGLEVSFPEINITMQDGDSLILYTDGITEAVNSENEQFGRQRLLETFSKAQGSSTEKITYLLSTLHQFTQSTPIDDDITMIVLTRTAMNQNLQINTKLNDTSDDNLEELE